MVLDRLIPRTCLINNSIIKVRLALDKYCELDTLAEIYLVEGLREIVEST